MQSPSDPRRRTPSAALRTCAAWLCAGLVLGAAGSLLLNRAFHRREATPALRGEAIAREQGCFACHGPEGRGGVADPGSRNGMIPGWDLPTVSTLAANNDEVIEWILDGIPKRLKEAGTPARHAPLVPMPAYRDRLTQAQLADLMVYFRAVSHFDVEMPEPVYEGWKVADRLGCFGCHGPGGTGGSPNPGSFKGHIPAWDGAEYPELVRNEEELMEWILDGHPKRLWDNPVARHFLTGQVIGMPAYRAHLSAADQARLLAYFQWLRKSSTSTGGPEDAHKIMGVLGLR